MSKKIIRYFIDFTDKQEKWLNEMAGRGFRLVRYGKLTYEFESCLPDEYQYRVAFIGAQSYDNQKDYKNFLESLGYIVYQKNINLNWSFGKARFRPWADGSGKISAVLGSYNRELLIAEKKNDGKPFEIHTDIQDLITYFKNIRNSCFYVALSGIIFAALFAASLFTELNFAWGIMPEWGGILLFSFIGAVSFYLAVKYGVIARRYKEIGKTNE